MKHMRNRTTMLAAITALLVAVPANSSAQMTGSTLPNGQTTAEPQDNGGSGAWTERRFDEPLIPGAPFVTYAGDEAGAPLLLLDAGTIPLPGEQDVVLRVPQAGLAGAAHYFRTGGLIICYYRPGDLQDGSLIGKPQWTVGRPHADLGEISWADNHTELGNQQATLDLADNLPDLGARRDDTVGGDEAAAGIARDVVRLRPAVSAGQLPPGPAVVDLGSGGSLAGDLRASLRPIGDRTPPPVPVLVGQGGSLPGGLSAAFGTIPDDPVPNEDGDLLARPAPAVLILHTPVGGGPAVGSGASMVLLVNQQLPQLR